MSIDWLEPEATVRGSVVVIAGRGEHAGVYRRFARRIAVDGYRIAVVVGDRESVLEAIDGATEALPVVVIGSDSGATTAFAVAAADPSITGVVAAGLLVDSAARPSVPWPDELEIRSACPVHRGALDSAGTLDRGALFDTAAAVTAEVLAVTTIPTLVVHGSADVISDVDQVVQLAQRLPDGRVAIVNDGLHDILNDVSHRSVAAEVVQFLERLRLPGAPDIITRVPAGALAR